MKSEKYAGKCPSSLKQGFYFLILALILILPGCTEKDTGREAIFQGLVMDYDENIPKPGTMVIINRFDALVILSANPYSNLIQDSVMTDENGLYNFRIDVNDKALYKITVSSESYLEKEPSPETLARIINYYPINEDTIYIGKSGFVCLSITNVPDGNDSLFLKCNMDRPPPATWEELHADHTPHAFRLYHLQGDTTIMDQYLYKDNDSVYYSWEITDKPDNKDTALALLSLDTVFLQIYY